MALSDTPIYHNPMGYHRLYTSGIYNLNFLKPSYRFYYLFNPLRFIPIWEFPEKPVF